MDIIDVNQIINSKIKKMDIIERTSGSKFMGRITHAGVRKSFYGNTKGEVRNKARQWLLDNFDVVQKKKLK